MLEDYDIAKLKELVAAKTSELLKQNRRFIEGDHWQEGAGWIGPMPTTGEPAAQIVIAELSKAFTSANKIAEGCDRHSGGVVGKPARWSFKLLRPMKKDEKPTDQEQVLIDEVEAAFTEWWNKRDVQTILVETCITLLFAERAGTRIFVPEGRLDEGGTLLAPTLVEALRSVFIEHTMPENSTVYFDPLTLQPASIVVYKNAEDKDVVEISFLADDGINTIVRVQTDAGAQDTPIPLNRNLIFEEALRPALITKQVQENQRALNLALSMLPRNVVTGGFLELIMTNAQLPGTFDVDEGGNPIPGTFKRIPFRRGAGVANFVHGTVDTDDTGKAVRSNPGVHFREPVPVDSSINAIQSHYRTMLEEMDQAHVLMNDDPGASGISRLEARIEYVASLMLTQPLMEKLGRWILDTALAYAEIVLNAPGRYSTKLRGDFSCRLHAGALTPDERQQILKEVEAGIMPKEYAMALLGIDDVDAALAILNADKNSQLNVLKKRADIIKTLTDSGFDIVNASELAGFTPEEIAIAQRAAALVPAGGGEDDDNTDDDELTDPDPTGGNDGA